ncbi:MucR family transcriptional regulator (plasmid) [Geobacter anodireducens]|nr:MucR family transcriptional regulator [Geobacter anodireducens]
MPSLVELTAEIVSAHVGNSQMTSEEMLQEIQKVHAALKTLETGAAIAEAAPAAEQPKQLTLKQAFKKDAVVCMICGKSFTTLKRHLSMAHDLKPGQYRKQFNIPASMPLAAKSYSESRRQAAQERGLGDILAKAREKRSAAKKEATSKATGARKPKGKVPAKKD